MGIFISIRWRKRQLWEGHLAEDIQAEQLINLIQRLWDPVLGNEEIRLIHSASASRLLPEHPLNILNTWDHKAGAFVLHIITRVQGGGGSKNPQIIALKNQVAGVLLDLQYELDWISKAVDSLFNHLGHAAVAALMTGKKDSKATAIMGAMKQIGLELPRKRSGALDTQSSSRQLQVMKKKTTTSQPHQCGNHARIYPERG